VPFLPLFPESLKKSEALPKNGSFTKKRKLYQKNGIISSKKPQIKPNFLTLEKNLNQSERSKEAASANFLCEK